MPNPAKNLVVAAAIITDDENRILLARRPAGRHMAGLWEFPGGKVTPDEHPARALERELAEELGVASKIGPPRTFAIHEEPGLRILLLFFDARIVGTPHPLEHQELIWVSPSDLDRYEMPPADAALVRSLLQSASPPA